MLVAQSCLTLCDPKECNPLGCSIYGILQAIILECVTIPFSRGSSQSRDQTQVSCIAGRYFIVWATREAQKVWIFLLFRLKKKKSHWMAVTLTRGNVCCKHVFLDHSVDVVRPTLDIGRCSSGLFRMWPAGPLPLTCNNEASCLISEAPSRSIFPQWCSVLQKLVVLHGFMNVSPPFMILLTLGKVTHQF